MTLTYEQAFELIHKHVALWEGDYSDHKADPGGVTKYGVSLRFLQSLGLLEGDIDGDGDIDRDDVLAVTPETARAIFRKNFWDRPRAESLPPLVAMAFYDLAVNAGAPRSAIVLQQAINAIYPGAIEHLAGNVGPLTRKWCAQAAADGRQLALCLAEMDARTAWYRRLVAARPSSNVFFLGWQKRTLACRDLLCETAQKWGIA